MTITELREKRANTLNAAKAFLNSHRTEKDVLTVEDDAAYAAMEQEIADYSREIARLERQQALEDELNRPTSKPLTSQPEGLAAILTGRASNEYKLAMLDALCSWFKRVSNVLTEGTDANGGYIWQPSYQAGEPATLLGYAVHTSAYAPADAIAFGDYSYYNIGDRGTRSFAELKELFAGNGLVGFVAKERVYGKLILPKAV